MRTGSLVCSRREFSTFDRRYTVVLPTAKQRIVARRPGFVFCLCSIYESWLNGLDRTVSRGREIQYPLYLRRTQSNDSSSIFRPFSRLLLSD